MGFALKTIIQFILLGSVFLTACTGLTSTQEQSVEGLPTATLAPIVSMTPRFTATPVPSRTALPTFTFTPSNTPITPTPSNTPTPSATPPVTGIVASLQTVNVREAPSVNSSAITALVPGTGVEILGQNEDGRWLNILMDDGRQGWIATTLVRINPTPTAFPTATPSPDYTAIALGTSLPTAILGGGTITPTPPRSVVTATAVTNATASGSPTAQGIPVIDLTAIQGTATALALPTLTPVPSITPLISPTPSVPFIGITFTPSGEGVGSEGNTGSQQGVDVLAYCDNKAFGRPAPANLTAGATIDVFWSWFASTPEQVQQHVDNAVYDVSVDGTPLSDWGQYGGSVRKQNDGNYYKYWYVPFGPLAAGQHTITYRVTWNAQITDGYDVFGPGTNRESEAGTCTFLVR